MGSPLRLLPCAALGLLAMACGHGPCGDGEPGPCPGHVQHAADLQWENGSAAWRTDGTTFEATELVGAEPSLGACRVLYSGWRSEAIDGSVVSEGTLAGSKLTVELSCNHDAPSESRMYHMNVEIPGDSRGWAEGTFEVSSCYEWYRGCEASYAGSECGRVVVEEATGAIAPFPEVVTPDFRRVFRIELDTFGSHSEDPAGECTGGVRAALPFVESAAGFQIQEVDCHTSYCA
jgi:hypothetical protein